MTERPPRTALVERRSVDGESHDDSYERSTDGPDVKVNTSNGSITVVGVAA